MLLSRREMLAGLAFVPAVASFVPSTKAAGLVTKRFAPRSPAARPPSKRLFGTAIRPDQLFPGTAIEARIRRDCGLLVPEFHGQWSAVEWVPGQPFHGNYDAIVDYAQATGKAVRGHALLWEQMTPDWAREAMAQTRDWAIVRRHFASLLPRYSGRIGEWVVVNEMIDTEHGDGDLRRTSFQRAFGNDYVARALETARELDPAAKLMINDYSLSQDNSVDSARRSALLRLVEALKRRGVPLDSVGIQGHLELAKGPVAEKALAAFLVELAAMGVEIAVTELDVLESDRRLPLDVRDRRVAEAVEHFLDVVCDQPAVTSVVTWGLSDEHSWLQDKAAETRIAQAAVPIDSNRLNRGLPYDSRMRAKPMLEVIVRKLA